MSAPIDRCADCKTWVGNRSDVYFVIPPQPRSMFSLCGDCWQRIVGAATFDAIP